MTTTRPQIPATNLKERIAALELRNVSAVDAGSRATSPTPGMSMANTTPPAGGLRDKIAKFERKGGVPVPRGRFGLGVPPPSDGPRRQGELYGNRIPAPARASSATYSTLSHATSPTASTTLGSPTTPPSDQRRSVSLSSLSDMADQDDYTPITSPTFTFPLESPDGVSYTPEASPSLSANGDVFAEGRPRILRGTSFADALEIARKAETAKLELQEPPSWLKPQNTGGFTEEPEEPETTPTLLVSSSEARPNVAHGSPQSSSKELSEKDKVEKVLDVEVLKEETISRTEDVIIPPSVAPAPAEEEEDISPTEAQFFSDSTPRGSPTTGISIPLPVEEVEPPIIPQPVPSNPTVTITAPKDEPVIIPSTPEEPEISQPPVVEIRPLKVTKVFPASHKETRKAPPPLDAEIVKHLAPTLSTPSDILTSSTDDWTNFFVQQGNSGIPSTPPSIRARAPISPAATLPYDDPETPPGQTTPPPPPENAHDLLSPPPSGFMTGGLSSANSSIMSASSTGSRPVSMFENSPSQVTHALRITPAMSRGIPVFLPANNPNARKSDFVYFPPTPEVEETEFGSVSLHKSSSSFSGWSNSSSKANNPVSPSFSSVVYRKMGNGASSSEALDANQDLKPLPQTPQISRIKRATILEPPMSPGQGDLVSLLKEAVLLEDIMDKGELPTELSIRHAEELEQLKRIEEAKAAAAAKAREEAQKKQAFLATKAQMKRDEPTSAKLKHTFLIPLSRARTLHRKDVSSPAELGVGEDSSGQAGKKSLDLEQSGGQGLGVGRSPKSSRFGSFRRLGSLSRTVPQARTSNSTSSEISSEDSNTVITPPDNALEFGAMRSSTTSNVGVTEFGHIPGASMSFPSLSPKKSSHSVGRAASFAEKMWSRARTKSGASSLSSTSEVYERHYHNSQFRLPPIGSTPNIDIASLSSETLPIPVQRSTSTKTIQPAPKSKTFMSKHTPLLPVPDSPIYPHHNTQTTHLLPPESVNSTRTPSYSSLSSAASLSSAGSLPSPLFDQALFDAFPSVPSTTPAPVITLPNNLAHRREMSLAAAVNSSFDAALLNSAIHLASSNKSTSNPATTTTLPSRSGEIPR